MRPAAPACRLASRPEDLEDARLRLDGFLDGQAVGDRPRFVAQLVLEEWFTNLLKYAYPDPGEHPVDATVWLDADALTLQFVDDGPEFDPTRASDPPRPASLSDATPGGLGLLLIRRLATSVEYRRLDRRNQLTVRIATRTGD